MFFFLFNFIYNRERKHVVGTDYKGRHKALFSVISTFIFRFNHCVNFFAQIKSPETFVGDFSMHPLS